MIEDMGGLSAEVAVLEVEVQRADAVRAADAGELRASLDPLGSVVFHHLIVSPRGEGTEHCGRVTKVPGTMSVIEIFRQSRFKRNRLPSLLW